MSLITNLRIGAGPVRATRKLERAVRPTGVERTFDPSEIIVSKTDLTGHITYVNRVFMRVAGFDERELLSAPHSIIRHPDMPRCVFKLLWDMLEAKQEVFAYVKNLARDGDHYWVFAHVTPSFGPDGSVVGYHSSRRAVDPKIVNETITPLYQALLTEEGNHRSRKEGMAASTRMLTDLLQDRGISYDQFVFSL